MFLLHTLEEGRGGPLLGLSSQLSDSGQGQAWSLEVGQGSGQGRVWKLLPQNVPSFIINNLTGPVWGAWETDRHPACQRCDIWRQRVASEIPPVIDRTKLATEIKLAVERYPERWVFRLVGVVDLNRVRRFLHLIVTQLCPTLCDPMTRCDSL